MKQLPKGAKVSKRAHIWKPQKDGHHVEPHWVNRRLFEVEQFTGPILDPCCGFGRIPVAARAAGHQAIGTDIVDRGFDGVDMSDFMQSHGRWANIVCNPPYQILEEFTMKALQVARHKVAMIWLLRRLPAARWLQDTPLARIYYINPRPSMPPGHEVRRLEKRGKEPSGGEQDFIWLVWDKKHQGYARSLWLLKNG